MIGLASAPQAFGDASALTLTNPTDGSATNDPTPTFSGTASTEAGDATTVTVTVIRSGVNGTKDTVDYETADNHAKEKAQPR